MLITRLLLVLEVRDGKPTYRESWPGNHLVWSFCIYKMASTAIANRLKPYLNNVISKTQTGFISGRHIGENTRIVYDLLSYTEKKQIPCLLMLIVSGGYYGFDFITPPPQCVERFHRYRSNEKNIIASLLKFTGYIHSHKILPGNIFGLILKNKMATAGVFRL